MHLTIVSLKSLPRLFYCAFTEDEESATGDWSEALDDGVICRGCALPLGTSSDNDGFCLSCRPQPHRETTDIDVDAYLADLSDAMSQWRMRKQEALELYRELLAKAEKFGGKTPDYLSFQLDTCLKHEVEYSRCLTFLEPCYARTKRDFSR